MRCMEGRREDKVEVEESNGSNSKSTPAYPLDLLVVPTGDRGDF